MKLLMLGWELPPHNSGGLGVACYHLCRHLALEGVEIDFVVPYTADHSDIEFMNVIPATEFSAEELRVMTSGIYDSMSYAGNITETEQSEDNRSLRMQQTRYTKFVKKLVSANDYDMIHAHDWLTYEAAIAAKKASRKPLVAHVHATEFDRAGGVSGNPLVHEIEYAGLLMADRIVAVSQATKNLIMERYLIPDEDIEVVHNGINTEAFTELPADNTYRYLTHMKQRGYTVVVSVGRLTIQKGLRYLLEATQEVIKHNPKVLLVIAGSGEQYHELIGAAAELGIGDNVLFTGFVRGAAWRDVYTIGDIFVMPSVSEPFGLAALEAAGYGNAVVLSKQSGVGEVLKHVLKFDFWDTHMLASQIVALVESQPLVNELKKNSQREFTHLNWGKAARACRSLYGRVEATVTPESSKQLWELAV